MTYEELEALQDEYNRLEHDFYSVRYKFWKAIAAIKAQSKLTDCYKKFEGRVRRDCKKKQRRGLYGKRPRGCQLDHSTPILYYYFIGIDDLETINGPDNMKWLPRAVNRLKGIKRAPR